MISFTKRTRITNTEYKRRLRIRHPVRLLVIILVVLVIFSLCIDGLFIVRMHTPLEAFKSIILWIRLGFANLTDGELLRHQDEIVAAMPYFGGVIAQVKTMGIIFISGMLMALSGSIFQMVFRNPMAAPTMLGVSTGVNCGVLLLVIQFGTYAYSMTQRKYLYCYIGAAIILTLVLLLGRISSGKKKFSVFDLLLAGTVISQIIGAIISFYTFSMDNDIVLIYQEIAGAINLDTTGAAYLTLFAAMLISIIPLYLMRFSFNAVGFEPDDTRSLGINSLGMKIITLMLGTFMITAAMIHTGSAGMISLIAPFIARGLFGADFRKQFWGNLLIGGGLLLACKDAVELIPFGTDGMPLGTMVDFIVVPLFVLIVASQRRTWE